MTSSIPEPGESSSRIPRFEAQRPACTLRKHACSPGGKNAANVRRLRWGGTYIEFDHVVVEDCGQTPTGEVGFMLLDTSWGYMKVKRCVPCVACTRVCASSSGTSAQNTVFRNNKAAYGSAIAMWGSTELHAVNVSVTNSSAAQGGAIFLGSQSYLKVGALSAASNTVCVA